ncbi:restriction endonuclease subunit S [Rheinheimera baltica]|uniref:restriction endonuclease subunit S n=1 Tax=Rheinheimera baltica TaxID=67576 RepID=UPI000426FF54|nr:restriction endonuclease subunit S [Rheinheimera baltica]
MNELLNNELNLGPHPQYPKSVKPGIPRLAQPKPGWKSYRIGELFEVINRPVSMEDEVTYQLVTVKRARGGVCEREKLKGKQISVKSQFYVKSGDFLISKRQIVHGACGFVPEELDGAIVSNEYAVLHCKDKLLPRFLNYLMHTPYFQQTCFHSSIGVHVEKMIFKLEEWFNWEINIPSIDEQIYISDFMDSVNKKAGILASKLCALKEYKYSFSRGVFQQKIAIRKNDGSNFSSWKKINIGNVFEERSEKSCENLELLSVTLSDGVVKRSDIESKNNSSDDKRNYKKVCPGDIAYNSMRMWQGASGISEYLGIVSPAYTVLKPDPDVDVVFFSYFFKYDPIVFLFRRYSQGLTSDTWNLKYPELSKIEITVPQEKEEQEKISKILVSLDKKIALCDLKLRRLITFKTGLINSIFS